jgi:predicted DCC family thiol-disulfide oxidoreductase YuxK
MRIQKKLYLWLTGLAYYLGQSRAFVAAPRRINRNITPVKSYASTESIGSSSKALSPPSTVLQKVFEDDNRPIILFDGVCNLCNSAVNLALDWDPKGKLRFSALQSNVGRSLLQAHGRKADDISSIVFVTAGGAFTKSDAILGITQELNPLPFVPLAMLGKTVVPQFLRDLIYDGVADNRYSIMGMRDECRFDADGEYDDRFVDDSLALAEY